VNDEEVLDQNDKPVHPIRLHYLEALDALANTAKCIDLYPEFINVVLQVTAIMLSEIDEQQVEQVISTLAAQAQEFRAARNAAMAKQQQPTEGAVHNVH
jgi:hypothetical protein